MTRAYVGLGANLGDRERALREAVAALGDEEGIEVVAVSTLRETDPVGVGEQPLFLNGAAAIDTALEAGELLDRLLAVEQHFGRVRVPGEHAPRTLDLDLLLYGDERIAERRPGHAESRSDIPVILHVRLRFVPHAGRDGESFSQPDIVLQVKAGLQVEVCDVRIADPPGVASRRAGNVRVVVFEHVRTEVI